MVHGRETCALLLGLSLLAVPELARAQLLDRASRAVRGADDQDHGSSRDDDRSSRSSRSRDDDDYDSGSSWSGRDRRSRRGSSRGSYRSGSYSSGGYVRSSSAGPAVDVSLHSLSPYGEGWWTEDEPNSRAGLRIDGEVGYAIGGAARGAIGLRAHLGWVALAARYSGFLDPSGEEVRGALLGRVAFEVFLVQQPGGELRIGGAFRHWEDPFGAQFGFDLGASFDVYPIEPLIVSGEVAAGMLGEAIIVLARLEIGVMIDATELFLAYHYEGLMTQASYVDLGGPAFGVRAWF